MARTTALTTDDELAVLRQFARGADINAIEADLGFTRDQVADVVQAIGFQRARAAELVRQHEAGAKRKANTPPPAASKPALARAPAAPAQKPAPGPDLINQVATPEPATPRSIEDLLQRAETIPRLRTRAARVRELVDALADDVETAAAKAAEIAEAEKHVSLLRDQLETASRALRDLTRPKPPPAASEPSTADIRAWATEHDVECPAFGRIPNAVRQQYNAARSAA